MASIPPDDDPVRHLCMDDTFSRTEWFNHPVIRFTGGTIDLGNRAVSQQEFLDWAAVTYRQKAERSLWVQIGEGGEPGAEAALARLLQEFPDMRLHRIDMSFSCRQASRGDSGH